MGGRRFALFASFVVLAVQGTSKDVNNRETRRGKVAVGVAECVQPTCTVIVGRV